MKVFKKNQIIVFVIGLMVIAAGYLNFTNNASLEAGAIADSEEMAGIGDAKLVSANIVEENANVVSDKENNELTNKELAEENMEENNMEGNTIIEETEEADNQEESSLETSTTVTSDEYFTNSRLERNTMYSQQIENYQDILSNTNVSEAQKKIAQEEITKISNEQNAIMIAENLIKTKGIEDLMIFVNNESINVIVKGDEPTKEEIAQIQNIITRELNADIADIHIMNKV
mgnify:CR=1 FL=1